MKTKRQKSKTATAFHYLSRLCSDFCNNFNDDFCTRK